MAIVETIPITAISFHNVLTDFPQELWNKSIYFDFYVQDNSGNFYKMNEFSILNDGEGFSYYGETVSFEDVYFAGDGWLMSNIIYFVNLPTDNKFIEWMNNNGDYFEPNKKWQSLYTHENGQWVYKCEIV